MKRRLALPTLALCAAFQPVSAQIPPATEQIRAALLAAPADRRDGARILGYDAAARIVTLREGMNDIVCSSDDPNHEGFEVACWHISIEPYMARGRELAAQGMEGNERNTVRWKEAESGQLAMPDRPASLFVVTGARYDTATGVIENEYRRSVLYIPFATAESTGLSTQASDVDPWIMFPGTAGAHIMITPPRARRN
jgi:hypothetical protein